MQTKILTLALVSSLAAGMFALAPATKAADAPTPATGAASLMHANPPAAQDTDNHEMQPNDTINCKMDFTLTGWSVFYKSASGKGTVRCDNGQTMDVVLNAVGGGLTFGTYKINDGHGNFNGVTDINQIIGSYAKATAHAGAVKSSHAAVMTKNDVTLTLTGTGNGWNIGVGFEGFQIKRASVANANAMDNHGTDANAGH
ncbi:MAG TPA: hypothetical protein VFK31_03675 [Rhodanobacteraceae bacterium]|nr:hypothetical protein [Rhodanobacteraceae bacterium]